MPTLISHVGLINGSVEIIANTKALPNTFQKTVNVTTHIPPFYSNVSKTIKLDSISVNRKAESRVHSIKSSVYVNRKVLIPVRSYVSPLAQSALSELISHNNELVQLDSFINPIFGSVTLRIKKHINATSHLKPLESHSDALIVLEDIPVMVTSSVIYGRSNINQIHNLSTSEVIQ